MPIKGRKMSRKQSRRKSVKIVALSTKAKVPRAVKVFVNKAIRQTTELKYASSLAIANNVAVYGAGLSYASNGANPPIGVGRGWSSGVSVPTGLIPTIAQGTTEGTRIGNRIEPKALRLRFSLSAKTTTDATTPGGNLNPFRGVPFIVKVIVYRHKYAQDDYSQSLILQNGATSEDLASTVDDLFKPYNKDEYTIYYSKNFMMEAPQHSNVNGLTTNFCSPRSSAFVMKSVKIPLPKHLLFNDNSTQCTNAGMFMAVSVCNTDNTDISTDQSRVFVNAEVNLSYTDA